jgi:hypothetical protein
MRDEELTRRFDGVDDRFVDVDIAPMRVVLNWREGLKKQKGKRQA